MPEYTLLAIASVVGIIAVDLIWFHSRIFRSGQYWLSMTFVLAGQIAVDGWLTKSSAPIVRYPADAISGLRPIWDIPIEDFGFGFSLATLTIMVWRYLGRPVSSRRAQHPHLPG